MINTKLTRKAMIIAYNAHMKQFDREGVPYIYHPIHIAEQMDTETECIVALLHDVVEDTDITFEQLEKDFPPEIIAVLKILTHDEKVDYMDYIKKVKENPIATKVKIVDIMHNSDESRLDKINAQDIARKNKYKQAMKLLKESDHDA